MRSIVVPAGGRGGRFIGRPPRRAAAPSGASPRPAPGPGEGDGTDRRGDEHGDLTERVEAAEVDEDDVDDVAPFGIGQRPIDHLGRDGSRRARLAGDDVEGEHGDRDAPRR